MERTRPLCSAATLLALLTACGGADSKVNGPDTAANEPLLLDYEGSGGHQSGAPDMDDDDDDGMEIEGLRGYLSSYEISKGIDPHSTALANCFHSQAKRKKYLGGDIELSFVVNRDGSVKSVRVSKSTLGAWPVEECLLEIGQAMSFAKPKGGEADFSIPLEFEPSRSPNWWSEEKGESVLGALPKQLASCAKESGAPNPRNVWVTLYLANRGVISSSGFASPNEAGIDPKWAQCAATKISKWTLADPRGKIAKLGFRYNPE